MRIRKKIFAKPFDLGHSILFNEFPAEYTKTIGVPGTFVKKINRRVHLKDGTTGEMDSAFILDPDGEILHERVAACLEHQSTPVNFPKLGKLGNYDTQLVVDEHMATLLIVATHLNPEASENTLIRSPSDITIIYFLDLGEENICKRLSRVSEIIENNQYLSTEQALNLGVIVLYAPRKHACEITEKVVNLYLEIVNDLDFKMEYCLYSVISIMIDAYFDDEKEYRRLIEMMDGETSHDTKEAFAATKESFLESLEWTKEDLATAKEDLADAKEELTDVKEDLAVANGKIAELEAENSKIPQLEAEVERLTAKLNGK